MSRKQELASLYAKERRRVQAYYSRYRKKNYSIPENAIPAIPKRITEGSIRRLQRMTPAYMKKKLVREEKRIQREEKRKQKWIAETKEERRKRVAQEIEDIKPAGDYYISEADEMLLWEHATPYEQAVLGKDWSYLNDYTDPNERVDNIEKYYDKNITELSQSELERHGFTKTEDGFIVDTETGITVARDMTNQIQENMDFIEDMEKSTGLDMSEFKDADFQWEDIATGQPITKEEYEQQIHDRKIENRRENTSSWAYGVIQGFIKDIAHFPTMAYPMLNPLIMELKHEALQVKDYNKGIERLAIAITSTIDELGRISYEVAYNGQFLNNFATTLERKFHNDTEFMKALNEVMELNEGEVET